MSDAAKNTTLRMKDCVGKLVRLWEKSALWFVTGGQNKGGELLQVLILDSKMPGISCTGAMVIPEVVYGSVEEVLKDAEKGRGRSWLTQTISTA